MHDLKPSPTHENYLYLYATSFVYDNHYVSLLATSLVAELRGLDDESCAVTIKLWAMDAELEVHGN
jgi:hypothetical protein